MKEAGAYETIATMALRYLKPGSKILDFGCGPCDKIAILQQLGFHCSGYDDLQDYWHALPGNREKILAFASNFKIDFNLAGNGRLPFGNGQFDMVMSHDVLEHLHNSPRDLLNDLLELTNPDGILFVTMPNAVNIKKRIKVVFGKTNLPPFEDYYWYPGAWRGHVREYVRDDLIKLAEYLNLDILELKACDHMLQKLPRGVRTLYLCLTKLFPGWKDTWLLVAKKRKNWEPRKMLPKEQLIAIIGKNTSYQYT